MQKIFKLAEKFESLAQEAVQQVMPNQAMIAELEERNYRLSGMSPLTYLINRFNPVNVALIDPALAKDPGTVDYHKFLTGLDSLYNSTAKPEHKLNSTERMALEDGINKLRMIQSSVNGSNVWDKFFDKLQEIRGTKGGAVDKALEALRNLFGNQYKDATMSMFDKAIGNIKHILQK